ncbi:hypothetical protein E2C01_086240 [Portunus trituberculatus]|uniref:Uncharacterized protein n=1 Tax=Portunus trituberculatus TaxID=210409 RepID=A0A5B7J8R6_PORTR|nr:hypothetical protein [Portunus trituberculatus]
MSRCSGTTTQGKVRCESCIGRLSRSCQTREM